MEFSQKYTYKAHQSEHLMEDVREIICVLHSRGLTIAGFGDSNLILMISEVAYGNELPEWNPDFFQYQFINNPLIKENKALKGVYIQSEKMLVIPKIVYDEKEANKWLEQIYLIPNQYESHTFNAIVDAAILHYSVPKDIADIIYNYLPQSVLLPLATYQYFNPQIRPGSYLQCVLDNGIAICSLRYDGGLVWHHTFQYTSVEDLVFHFSHLCRQMQIHLIDLNIECTAIHQADNDVVIDFKNLFLKNNL